MSAGRAAMNSSSMASGSGIGFPACTSIIVRIVSSTVLPTWSGEATT